MKQHQTRSIYIYICIYIYSIYSIYREITTLLLLVTARQDTRYTLHFLNMPLLRNSWNRFVFHSWTRGQRSRWHDEIDHSPPGFEGRSCFPERDGVRPEAVLGHWSRVGFPSWFRPGTGWGTGWGTSRWGWSSVWRRAWQVRRRQVRSSRRCRSGGRGLGQQAGHADLRAALAEDGQLRAAVHPAARQRRMPVLQVHSKVSVHRPAAPFPLDLRLHLEGYTSQGHY